MITDLVVFVGPLILFLVFCFFMLRLMKKWGDIQFDDSP